MQTARRRSTIVAWAVSLTTHAVVLAILAAHAPMLRIPYEQAGPPEPIIPILLMPRAPPPVPGSAAPPAPIRLHRRVQPHMPQDLPIAPLPVPAPAPPPPPAPPRPQAVLHPAPLPEGPKAELRTILRSGPVGCANLAALSRAEREGCDDAFGRGAREAAYIPPGVGLSAAKRALLDQAVAGRAARKAGLERPAPLSGPRLAPTPQDYDGEPYESGAGAQMVGQATYPPSTRAARSLGRLPP